MIFYIPSSEQLARAISLPKGHATFKQFTDGEWHVQIHDEVKGKSVWVLAQTGAPADTIIQLLLLCDALQRAGATLNIFLSYMGYARQDKLFAGQALSVEVMCKLIALSQPKSLHALQLHNPAICSSLFTNHIPYPFFDECIGDNDIVVAPDKGAALWAGPIAANHMRQLVRIEKQRPAPERVIMQLSGDVCGKRALIVDDMITTGNTILEAARVLFEHGAVSVQVACTHGLFTGDAKKNLLQSTIQKIYVTNSLPQEHAHDKITVVDIAPFINEILKE
ncbi:MAG: ribose-phosphate diphosphokinase [Candidatus Babeliales bacterium]